MPTILDTKSLPLQLIVPDPRLQPRVEMDLETIKTYAEAMIDGEEFDPVDVFTDGENFWLAHGYNRYGAAREANIPCLSCNIYEGSFRDALLFSLGANKKNGLRMSRADRRKAVETMLQDGEWGHWSDNEIAKQCGVTPPTVARIRREAGEPASDVRTYVTKHGTVAEMKVAKKTNVTPDVAPGEDPLGDFEPPQETPRADGQEAAPALGPETGTAEDDLTDGDWLSSLPLWPYLGRNRTFQRSALLYRTIKQRGLLGQMKNGVIRSRGDKPFGGSPLERLCSEIIQLRHPKDWQLCRGCNGAGCGTCGGGGYVFAGGTHPSEIKGRTAVAAAHTEQAQDAA